MSEADINNRFDATEAAAAELEQDNAALLREHAELLGQREHLFKADPPRADALAGLAQILEQLTPAWRAKHALGLIRDLGGALEETKEGEIRIRPPQIPSVFHERLSPWGSSGLLQGLLKQELTEIITTANYEPGKPMADRPGLIAEIDIKIRDVERRQTHLAKIAAKHRITMELLPAVAQRLKEDAERRREAPPVR